MKSRSTQKGGKERHWEIEQKEGGKGGKEIKGEEAELKRERRRVCKNERRKGTGRYNKRKEEEGGKEAKGEQAEEKKGTKE